MEIAYTTVAYRSVDGEPDNLDIFLDKRSPGNFRKVTPESEKILINTIALHLQQQLKATEYVTLKILVYLFTCHKQVSLKLLASLMLYPIQVESHRHSLQRFKKLNLLPI
ncbi:MULTISPECIES: hypothetical protein [unclassified Microcoleus]|uniref:hypothetical protein n=1 Tax=unclassified Microcoleus TaxID=2642155 RepID=UPI002FD1147A